MCGHDIAVWYANGVELTRFPLPARDGMGNTAAKVLLRDENLAIRIA